MKRCGIARARTGRHSSYWRRDRGTIAAGEPQRADRVHANPRSVGAGFVENLARPGGNLTGFAVFEYGFGAKYVELLKEIAPRVTRVAVLRDFATTSGTAQFAAIQALAPSFGLEVIPLSVRDGSEIERAVNHSRVPRMVV